MAPPKLWPFPPCLLVAAAAHTAVENRIDKLLHGATFMELKYHFLGFEFFRFVEIVGSVVATEFVVEIVRSVVAKIRC
jgi:hypothetical protein